MRGVFMAALIAGVSYLVPVWTGWEGTVVTLWKGAGVALLALWAALLARNSGGWLIAIVLALGATGDVLLEASGLTIGAVAFLAGHVVATILYLRNGGSMRACFAAAVTVAAAAYALTDDAGVALYSLGLGMMAGGAVTSGLPLSVAVGAVLFVVSDLLIFARLGPLSTSIIPTVLVWPTYFAGQALIAWGAVGALRRENAL